MTTNSDTSVKKLTRKELKSGFWRTFATSHAWHFERQQHMAFAWSMIPTIKRLYDRKEDRVAAYQRHLEFYNCQTTMQPLIFGITAAMEEENANNPEFDTSSISAMKVALMGPLAGIGDSLLAGTLRIIATGIAAGLCMAGSLMGPILFLLLYNIPTIALRYFGVKYGYQFGNTLIGKIAGTDVMHKLTTALGIVGLMVIGAMVAATVSVTTPVAFNISGSAFSLQETLDSIFPKLLPLATVGLLYRLNRKHVNVLLQIIGIMAAGIVLGALGILG